ncbi:type I restriction-modification system specificity subunit [Deinococcus rubellus]|uniref:restriction endonuclease subunit S n=1 Tax=Deinococcus rubellus TaxID=1889240 RepID=UPI0031ED3A73
MTTDLISDEREGLPEGWAQTNLGQLSPQYQNGISKRFGEEGKPMPVLRLADIERNQINTSEMRSIKLEDEEALKYKIGKSDILIIRVNGSADLVGSFIGCKDDGESLAYCDHFIRVRFADGIDSNFLTFLSRSRKIRYQIESNFVTTAGQKTVNQGHISSISFALPPLPEQIRIADKLDALLSRVEAGRERLERVPKLLKRFRQSVLSAAVSGELTREWRGGGDAEWEESQPIRNYTDLDVGYAFKSADFTSEGIRLLRGDNIEPSKLRWRDAKCMPAESLKDFEDYEVLAGDVILAMDRPIISSGLKIAVASEYDVPCMLVQRVCRFRPKRNIRARFLYIALNTEDFVRYLGDEQNGTQVPHISAKQILGFEFLLPPLPEQAEIVRRVEALFAIADRIEARYQSALTTFNRLTPALLAKAFRGELVPQDPNDEPASVLLERIRAARAMSGDKPKRGRGAAKEADNVKPDSPAPDDTAPKRRGRPHKAQTEAPDIAQASSYEDAVRQLEAQKAARAAAGKLEGAQVERGTRQDGLFENAEVNS